MEGLRERKKQATRAALIEAARRLGAERGASNVRLEDIAAAAGVSPRTVGNYFSTKEELMLAIGADRAARVAAALVARPAGEPLWQALEHVLVSEFAEAREVTKKNVAAAQATPAQVSALTQVHRAIEPVLAEAIAARTGLDAGRHLYPRLAANAVLAANRAATDHWVASDDPSLSLPGALREALRQLTEGLPVPHTATEGKAS
jgi:AcrR family transcriptional regulator